MIGYWRPDLMAVPVTDYLFRLADAANSSRRCRV